MKAIAGRYKDRWHFLSFRGKKGGEWVGVVDVLAIRKDTNIHRDKDLNRGDLFDIMLIQVKGGSARPPTRSDRERLLAVAKLYHAKRMIYFHWRKGKKGKTTEFREIMPDLTFGDVKPSEEFFG